MANRQRLRFTVRSVKSAGPKRGCLTWELEIRRKAAGKRRFPATLLFQCSTLLQCSFSLVAAQFLVKMTSTLQKRECCSATSAAQHFENCSATSVFACGMLQGWGLEGWGLGLPNQNYRPGLLLFLPTLTLPENI